MAYELTPSQQTIQKFIERNVPEMLTKEDHFEVLTKLISKSFGDMQDSDDLLKTLVSIDDVPDEYLEDLAQMFGYELDMTLEPRYQKFFMKKFLPARKRRGTALALKIVGASYAKDAMSYLDSGIPNDIEVVEYGINDQNYTPGLREVWMPGVIAITLLENSDIVKDKLRAMTPAGIRMNLNVRQQLHVGNAAVPKVQSTYETTLNTWVAMHRMLFKDVFHIPYQEVKDYTIEELNTLYGIDIEIGMEITGISDLDFVDALASSKEFEYLSSIFTQAFFDFKASSATTTTLQKMQSDYSSSASSSISINSLAKLLVGIESSSNFETTREAKTSLDPAVKATFRETFNEMFTKEDSKPSSEYWISSETLADGEAFYKQGDYTTQSNATSIAKAPSKVASTSVEGEALTRVLPFYSVVSPLIRIGETYDDLVKGVKLQKDKDRVNSEISYTHTSLKTEELNLQVESLTSETFFETSLSCDTEVERSEEEVVTRRVASSGFSFYSGANRVVEYFDQTVDDINVSQFRPEPVITYSYR